MQVARVAKEMEALYPLDGLDERRKRRDRALAKLAALKRDLPP